MKNLLSLFALLFPLITNACDGDDKIFFIGIGFYIFIYIILILIINKILKKFKISKTKKWISYTILSLIFIWLIFVFINWNLSLLC